MLRILAITSPDIQNGNGCRVTLWVAGCGHHCEGCHNEWAWNYNIGTNNYDEVLESLYKELDRDEIEGLTISGGDPLYQDSEGLQTLYNIIKNIKDKYPNKTIWIYSGFTYEEIIKDIEKKNIVNMCDVLIDGKFEKDLFDPMLPYRGSKNQRIIYIGTYNETKSY